MHAFSAKTPHLEKSGLDDTSQLGKYFKQSPQVFLLLKRFQPRVGHSMSAGTTQRGRLEEGPHGSLRSLPAGVLVHLLAARLLRDVTLGGPPNNAITNKHGKKSLLPWVLQYQTINCLEDVGAVMCKAVQRGTSRLQHPVGH